MDKDLAYALVAIGGGTLFFVAWWIFCIALRLGIDGLSAASRALNEKRFPELKKILLGTWLREDAMKPIEQIRTHADLDLARSIFFKNYNKDPDERRLHEPR